MFGSKENFGGVEERFLGYLMQIVLINILKRACDGDELGTWLRSGRGGFSMMVCPIVDTFLSCRYIN